jgi:hypothetical protein
VGLRTVIALGGNAISPAGRAGTAAEQTANLWRSMVQVAELVAEGTTELVLTHGNGPQVGNLLIQSFQSLVATVQGIAEIELGDDEDHQQEDDDHQQCRKAVDETRPDVQRATSGRGWRSHLSLLGFLGQRGDRACEETDLGANLLHGLDPAVRELLCYAPHQRFQRAIMLGMRH